MNAFEKNRENIKKALVSNDDWRSSLGSPFFGGKIFSGDKTEIMWVLDDLLKNVTKGSDEEESLLKKSIEIVEYFINSPIENEEKEQYKECDDKVRLDNDARWIVTVKGTAPHLIQSIVSRLNTKYYPKAISLTEQLLKDDNLYVRKNAIVALDSFAINIYAQTESDGTTPFIFDREKIRTLSFEFLKDKVNQSHPRILEDLTQVFNRLRRESLDDSIYFINHLIYKNGDATKKELHEEYVIRGSAPLLMYYAEFRKRLNDNFDDSYFKKLLVWLIENGDGYIKSGIIWHIWKTIDGDKTLLEDFEPYITAIFYGKFYNETISQIGLLIEALFPINLVYSIEIFFKLIKYIADGRLSGNKDIVWLLFTDNFFIEIAKKRPEFFTKCLKALCELCVYNWGQTFVGNYQFMFTAYSFIEDDELREGAKVFAMAEFEQMKRLEPNLNIIEWI